MRFLQQPSLWFVILVSFMGQAPRAQAFDLSQFFQFQIPDSTIDDPGLPAGVQCLGADSKPLPMMNTTVLGWKETTGDQWMARALVQGPITQFYADRNGHTHFGINLNSDGKGDLEVIYNDEFGGLPKLNVGMAVTACGDYITVGPHAQLPSPLGAIIHWVHWNPGTRDGGKHQHGFLIINNQVYGGLPAGTRRHAAAL